MNSHLQSGDWILLDELNLASQSVLEGLNAVFDHRGEVYIPELDRTFPLNENTRIFGCQNPLSEGGDRKGLPKSFLNRFSKVYMTSLSTDDYRLVYQNKIPMLNINATYILLVSVLIICKIRICIEPFKNVGIGTHDLIIFDFMDLF